MEHFYFTSRQNHFSNSHATYNRKFILTPKVIDRLDSKKITPSRQSHLLNSKEKHQINKNQAFFVPHLINANPNTNEKNNSRKTVIQSSQNFRDKDQLIEKVTNTNSFINWRNGEQNYILKKKPTKIQLTMNQKKQNFAWTLRKNFQKMNQSYINCIQNTIKNELARNTWRKLSDQPSINFQIGTKSNKSIIIKGGQGFNQKNLVEKHHPNDIFVKQNNMFSILIQSRKCMNGIFPMFRSGHSLCSLGPNIYLFGGINNKMANKYHFNAFNENQKEWSCLKNFQKSNFIIPSFHSVQTFRSSLIFIGGSYANQKKTKRLCNPDILIYDTVKQDFSTVRWNVRLRSHASTIYSNMLVIYGGIDQKNQFSSILYFLPLNASNIDQTKPIPYNMGAQGQGIAHHKMVNTFQIDINFKKNLAFDGIIFYGGKFADGKINSEILLFRFNKNQQSTETQNIIKRWEVVKTYGINPQPRYCHSMDILYKKCICLVIGGINEAGKALDDVWILDLMNSAWIKAVFDDRYQILQRGIFSHATTVLDGEVFIFGGINGQNKVSNEFWSVDFSYKRAAKKQQCVKKSRIRIVASTKIPKNDFKAYQLENFEQQ